MIMILGINYARFFGLRASVKSLYQLVTWLLLACMGVVFVEYGG